jgi:hypothetical protein
MTDKVKKEMTAAERGARANIDPRTLRDMVQAAPYHAMADLRAYGFAHSPCGMIPREPTVEPAPARPPASGFTEFVNPQAPAHPTPGVALLDRQLEAEAAREQTQAQTTSPSEKLLEVAQAVLQQQGEILKLVTAVEGKEK